MQREIRVGTRASALATQQTRMFCQSLCELFPDLTLTEVRITTEGDTTTEPLAKSRTPGVFVGALRTALLNHQVDFIVHSMKDLPVRAHPHIITACVPTREDCRDVLFSAGGLTLEQLPKHARVGTSSPRRAAQLRRQRGDLELLNIRGNIETRIEKVKGGHYDATVLARAGLVRLGREREASEVFEAHEFVPAPGQGALAIECRASDAKMYRILRELNDDESEMLTHVERAVLSALQAGCATPIGANAKLKNGEVVLTAELANEHTGERARTTRTAAVRIDDHPAAMNLGFEAAADLRETHVYRSVTDTFQDQPQRTTHTKVLLVRSSRNDADAHALSEFGVGAVIDPHLTILPEPNITGAKRLYDAIRSGTHSWLVVTSAHALSTWAQIIGPVLLRETLAHSPHLSYLAIGEHTKHTLLAYGAPQVATPETASIASLTEFLLGKDPAPLIMPCGSLALTTHDDTLQPRGFSIIREQVYRTEPVNTAPVSESAIRHAEVGAVLFRSPSAVRAFRVLHGVTELSVVCVGEVTRQAALEAGYTITAYTPRTEPPLVARLIWNEIASTAWK